MHREVSLSPFHTNMYASVLILHSYPRSWEAETGKFLRPKTFWSTEKIPEQPGLYKDPYLEKPNTNRNKSLCICLDLVSFYYCYKILSEKQLEGEDAYNSRSQSIFIWK